MHQHGTDKSEAPQPDLSGSQHLLAGIPITAQALCQQLIAGSSLKTNVGPSAYGQPGCVQGTGIPATVPLTVGMPIKHELPSRHSGLTGGTIHHHGPIPPKTGSSPSHTNLQHMYKMSNQQTQKTPGSIGHSSSAFAAANKLLMETKPLSGLSSTFPNLTAFANQSSSGPSPKKKVKLEEKPPPTSEIANYRKLVLESKIKEMLEIKENYIENLSELFFLQNGGNMMDYFVWTKRPTPQLVNFLKSSNVDSDEEEDHGLERKINNEVKVLTCSGSNVPLATPVAISTTLPPSVAALNQQDTTSPSSLLSPTVSSSSSITTVTPAVTMPQLQSQLTKTALDTKPLITSIMTKSSSSPALSSLVKTPKSPPVSPHDSMRPPQISAVYDGTVGIQEAIVERAKQEAQVMQRVAELRKDGMWSSRRLPKVQEPARCKGHWDYLLEEMQWLAADFQQERKWKKVAARKLAKMVTKHFQEQEQKEQKAEEEEGKKLKKIASQIAKHVKEFWSNIEKVVQYKQQSRLEEKRKKALDIHLNFIVDQTEKYSTWLTEGLKQDSTVGSSAGSVGSLSEAGDDEFKPEGDESDDEETIQKEEQEMDQDESSTKEELEALQKESEVPLEDLLKTLPSDILERPASLPDDDEVEEEDGKDKEFTGENEEEVDLEDTMDEQEKHEKKVDYSNELKDLEDEGDLPMDELYKKYAAAYDSDFEVPEDESGSDLDDDEDESEEEDSDEEVEEEEEEEVNVEDEVGLESLMEQDKDLSQVEFPEDGPGKELTDIAAEAQSLQPKGYTLETTTVKTKVPFLLKHTMREYQHVGLDWLATMYEKRLNGILADEMGLGKTIQTIALLAHLACEKVIWGPHLIVVPTSVMLNWELELKKWCPAFKILTYYGTQKERKLKRQGWTKTNAFHVCITSYKLVIQDHQAFRRKKWKYLILDEAQNIKNFKSQRWQMLLNFSSQRRLLLTGTPLQNSLMELWSLMHFLMPHVFQSHKEFKEWFANPLTGMIEGSHEYNESLIRRLHKVLRPFLLRRLKADVEKQMPKKFEHVVMCHLSKRQRYLYEDFMSQGATRDTLQSGHFMSVINVLMQLRKVCNHPSLFDPRPIVSPFQAEGIEYYTSSFVLKALEYDPFRDINLYSIYPSLADMELNLPAFVAHRVKGLQTNRKLIEEIDDTEEIERPAPGKLQPTSFPNVFTQSGRSSPAIASQSSVISSTGYSTSVPVMAPTVTSISTPGMVTTASTMPATSLVQTNKQQAKVGPQSAGQTIGQANIQTSSSTQPITVQIQQTDQGARLMIPAGQLSQLPAGFIQIVQTSLGQQIIATSAVSSVTTASSAVVNGHQAITTIASSSGTSTTMSTAVRTSSVQLPTSSMASQKPVMRVSPLTTDSQVSSSIINVTDSSGIKTSSAGLVHTRPVKRKQKKEGKKSEFYCSSLEEKKMREREQKLDYIARINEKHCSRVPVYGQDLCHTVDVFRDMNKTCFKDNTWKGLGMVYCHNVHTWPNKHHSSYYWKQTKVLSDLVNTPVHFLQKMEDIVLRYTFVTPSVTAPRIQMHVSHPPSHHLVEEWRRTLMLQNELSPKATCLHPISTRLAVQFPEKRLIQYDCGKLQVLDILLQRLKTGSHRVLIFTQMTKMLNILESFLNYHGHRYLRLDGTTKVEQRQFLMDKFNADRRIFVFILSTRSGGIGVNLTGADTVIFYDSDWNPTMDAQAQDRCHRIGQTRDVHIYRLISERTVEENILKKANQKRMLGDMAIEGGNFTTTFFKEQTIKDLFSEPSGLDQLVKEKETVEKTKQEETENLKMKSMKEVAGDEEEKAIGDTTAINQFEKALAKTEDETDVVAVEQVKAEQKAELAEFDENIPWDEREAERKREEDESKVEMELAMLEKELTPVERYAVNFMEDEMDPLAEELQIAEEDIENAKKDWELGRLKALKEEEERRLEVEEDEMLFTYTREDAFNQVKKSAKKSKGGGAKAKTPARTPTGRKRPAKKKDENFVIDEDKRRSDPNLSDPQFGTPKVVRSVGRPPKNKTPKPTPKTNKGRRPSKIDVETLEFPDETPKDIKSKRQRQPKGTPKVCTDEKANASKLVSKILAQAQQKAAVSIQQSAASTPQQITYSQQLLAQSQKAGLSKAQLASAIQKIQSPNPLKPTLQPQLLSASQLQHLKQIISNAHRNIAPGQSNIGALPQQTFQGQNYVPQSPIKSGTPQNPTAPVQQLFFQPSPSQQGQFVISQGQNTVPQLITQHQLSQIQQLQSVGTPSYVQVQGRAGVGTPTLLQIQGSQPGAAPSLVQINQPQNIPTFLQYQGSQLPPGSSPLIQVQGSHQTTRQVNTGTKASVPTTQVVHFQTSPSALLAQIQASRVHGGPHVQGQVSKATHTQQVSSQSQKTQPTIIQAGQGTQLVIPPSNISATARQTQVKTSQFPGYLPSHSGAVTQVKVSSITTPSIINVQNMPQQSTKLTTNTTPQYATIQDIQLVMSSASTVPKVAGSQIVSKPSPAIQQARQTTPQQNVQLVTSQTALSGGSIQLKQANIPQQVLTQNSAGQPVLSFIRMAGNQSSSQPQQNVVQFVNPSASVPSQTNSQQGVVYLQLAGGKAIPVSLASSQMTLPVMKTDVAKNQTAPKVRNVLPTLVVTQGNATQGNAIQIANASKTSSRINSPVSRFQIAGNIGQVQRAPQPRIRCPMPSARPAIATVGMAARQPPTDNTSATIPPPWNNPNLVIRTRRAAVQEACKAVVENGEMPVVQNQSVIIKSPPVVTNITTESNHIPSDNLANKNGCVTEVKSQ